MIGIDHMFISGDLAVETVTVPVNGTVRMASDHLPLFAEISLPDKVNQTNQPRCGI
jgi:endonuclease/exonuclease/phosphatase family metal-dependent hydrolase